MKITKSDIAAALVLVFIIVAMMAIMVAAQEENTQNPAPHNEIVQTSAPVKAHLPTTLAGYKRAFAKLPAYSWGGGDVAVTTVLKDGRAVWFFGDTLTKRGKITWMNRNTSLVQTGERMHAANDGVQIIPTTKDTVYWPVKVDEVRPGVLVVWTSMIHIGNGGPWDFKRLHPTKARKAVVTVNKTGDMQFVRWSGWSANPTDKSASPADGSDTRIIGAGHWGYQKMTHYDLPLRGGKHLVTESQNWDNGHKNTLDYRPILSQR